MKQSEMPVGSVITLGHPANQRLAAKGPQGWRLLDMRRQHARATQHAAELDRQRWLAGLTPEHRAKHQANPGVACLTCFADGMGKLAVVLPTWSVARRS